MMSVICFTMYLSDMPGLRLMPLGTSDSVGTRWRKSYKMAE